MTTCYEKADSLTFKVGAKDASAANTYVVLGTTDELEAIGSALAVSPATYTFGLGTAIITLVRSNANAKQTSQTTWEVDVDWNEEDSKQSQQRPEGQSIESMVKWTFDTTGQTQKITVGRSEIARSELDPSYPAPDLGAVINYDGKTIHGVDKIIPSLRLTATAPYAPSAITTGFVANLARNTGKTNSKDWQGFKAGELLYKGSTGAKDVPLAEGVARQKPFEITHNFEASQNQDTLEIGGITIDGGKKGWEYAWTRFEDIDDSNKIIYPRPVHAYIVEIYDSFDFKQLFGF